MRKHLLIPCTDIDESIEECKNHVCSEFAEFSEAYLEYIRADKKAKVYCHVMEEAIDLATSVLSLALKIEEDMKTMNGEDLEVAEMMVACKNYLRGYHDENPLEKGEMRHD